MNKLKFLSRLPYIFSSALLSTISSYVIYINISKDLSFEDFSTVSYWMNLGAIFTVLYDLGINQFLQVNYKKDIRILSQSLLGLKVILGLVISLIVLFLTRNLQLFIFITSFLFVSFQAFFSYYLRLQNKFFFDIVFNLVYYIIFVFLFLYLLKTKEFNATALYAWSHFAMRLVLVIIIFCLLIFKFKQKVHVFSIQQNWDVVKKVVGFSFLSILMVSLQNVDSVILYRSIDNAALFSKISMVIKIGFLNFAFFDSFITLVSASDLKNGTEGQGIFTNQFKFCLLFGILVSICIHTLILLLPGIVGDKWAGISDMSAWAIANNIVLYPLLYFQFKLLSSGKVRTVATALICFIICSSAISYFFISYQFYYLLSTFLRVAIAGYFILVYKKSVQPSTALQLQFNG